MSVLLGILIALIIIGVILWGIFKILAVVPVPEPFRTIIWVIVVIVAVLAFVQISGLYHFDIGK
jgi:predicted membrane channel-forming protein YqfA (hemolysin III family)